jgi:hypothetical protein
MVASIVSLQGCAAQGGRMVPRSLEGLRRRTDEERVGCLVATTLNIGQEVPWPPTGDIAEGQAESIVQGCTQSCS